MEAAPKGCSEVFWNDGEPGGTRTRDHRIKSAMLYQLSYRPVNDLQGNHRAVDTLRDTASLETFDVR